MQKEKFARGLEAVPYELFQKKACTILDWFLQQVEDR